MRAIIHSAAHSGSARRPEGRAAGFFHDLAEERAILLRLTDDLERAWRGEDASARSRALIILHSALASHGTIEDVIFSGCRSREHAAGTRHAAIKELRREAEALLDRTGDTNGDGLNNAATDLVRRLRAYLRADETPWPRPGELSARAAHGTLARRARRRVRILKTEVKAYERVIDEYL